MTDPSVLDLALLALVGLVAGAVNTVAGAGSLLLLPVLMWTGLPADAANATNRIGILAQTTMAVVGYHRAGQRIDRTERRMVGLVMVGGVAGSFIATLLSPESMELAIVVAMAGMLAASLIPPRASTSPSTPSSKADPAPPSAEAGASVARITLTLALGLLTVGVYGGFLQAGVGILLLLFLGHVSQMGLVRANVLKSYGTLGLTIAAMAMFYARGEQIDLARGLALASGSAIGGLYGAKATLRLGPTFVRRAVIVAIAAALCQMVWDQL
jgi:uncharacterized membrane protein YfcA